ncbi:hypothetical protein [Candidatus Darwinibacter acetoxidans]
MSNIDQRTPALATTGGFAAAAFPVFALALDVILRRVAELTGYAPNPGACLAFAVVAAAIYVTVSAGQHLRWKIGAIALLITVIAILAAIGFRQFPDHGFDAQSYHLPSVLRLMNGWKPMVEATDLTLSNYYPSGMWTILAGFDAIFGFESGRALGLILMIAAFSALWTVLLRADITAVQRTIICALLVGNPVALSQFFTSLVDGALYQMVLIFICSLILMLERRDLFVALLATAALILVINTKLTGLFFAATAIAIWAGVIIFRYTRRGTLPKYLWWQIKWLTLAIVLSVGFVGWRPYATNLLEYHRFVYPPPDELGYNPSTGNQIPHNLRTSGRIAKLGALFFARTNMHGGPIEFKVPGTFNGNELHMASDTRNGGFGPFFGVATILAIAALALAAFHYRTVSLPNDPYFVVLLFLTALGTAATAVFPEPWWARFVPFAWLMPLGGVWLAELLRPSPYIRACMTSVVVLSLLNMLIAGTSAVRDGIRYAADIDDKLGRMVRDPDTIYLSRGTLWNPTINGRHAAEDVWRRRLSDRGKTAVEIVARTDCKAIEFLTVDVERCLPLVPSITE